MKMNRVEDDKMFFRCKQCGNELEKTMEEVEKQNKVIK